MSSPKQWHEYTGIWSQGGFRSQMSSKHESFEKSWDFYPTPKIDDLKLVSHKEFKFMKGKGFKEWKD